MNIKNKELFINNIKEYFKEDAEKYLSKLNEDSRAAFFLNEKKANRDDIFSLIDFKYEKSKYTNNSFYFLDDSIGKSKVYELGLIYPQDIESSLPISFVDTSNIKYAIDLCSAPGGKSINLLNKLNDDVVLISNDINYKRATILANNLERLGLEAIITSNKIEYYVDNFKGLFDLVVLDVPCSGEGMVRKYPEILDDYSNENILSLAYKQETLLKQAYELLNANGQIIYSTCTYSFLEDEKQIINFLNIYKDMELIKLPSLNDSSTLEGTVKLSPLNDTEGQYMALLKKKGGIYNDKYNFKKTIKNKLVEDFIKANLNINNYYLYNNNEHYFMSFKPLLDIKYNVLNYGIYLGKIENKRFIPAHHLYRANSLINKYKYTYELNDQEYLDYISGKELRINKDDNYYLLTYHKHSLGYGKIAKGILKNKYPKGLRKVI